jgi:hypothetical protein
MNPEGEQADLLAQHNKSATSALNETSSVPPTLESEVYSNGTSNNISPESPTLNKDRLHHQNSHQGDSPKGIL